jgi:ribosome biogenesis protein ERB1
MQSVAFHKKYPLFASVSDDTMIHVFHGMVHADLNQNALIVPLKILRSHSHNGCEGVLDCAFHPTQPWLFSAGADKSIVMFCDET